MGNFALDPVIEASILHGCRTSRTVPSSSAMSGLALNQVIGAASGGASFLALHRQLKAHRGDAPQH